MGAAQPGNNSSPTTVNIRAKVFLEGPLQAGGEQIPKHPQRVLVREDVKDAIMQRHPDNTTKQTVLLEGAQAVQDALQAANVSDTATALKASEMFEQALACVDDDEAETEALFILTSTIDICPSAGLYSL